MHKNQLQKRPGIRIKQLQVLKTQQQHQNNHHYIFQQTKPPFNLDSNQQLFQKNKFYQSKLFTQNHTDSHFINHIANNQNSNKVSRLTINTNTTNTTNHNIKQIQNPKQIYGLVAPTKRDKSARKKIFDGYQQSGKSPRTSTGTTPTTSLNLNRNQKFSIVTQIQGKSIKIQEKIKKYNSEKLEQQINILRQALQNRDNKILILQNSLKQERIAISQRYQDHERLIQQLEAIVRDLKQNVSRKQTQIQGLKLQIQRLKRCKTLLQENEILMEDLSRLKMDKKNHNQNKKENNISNTLALQDFLKDQNWQQQWLKKDFSKFKLDKQIESSISHNLNSNNTFASLINKQIPNKQLMRQSKNSLSAKSGVADLKMDSFWGQLGINPNNNLNNKITKQKTNHLKTNHFKQNNQLYNDQKYQNDGRYMKSVPNSYGLRSDWQQEWQSSKNLYQGFQIQDKNEHQYLSPLDIKIQQTISSKLQKPLVNPSLNSIFKKQDIPRIENSEEFQFADLRDMDEIDEYLYQS